LNFSQDESLLVVGGLDHQLLLWRTEDVFEKKIFNPTALKNTTEVLSLAISPLNTIAFLLAVIILCEFTTLNDKKMNTSYTLSDTILM